MSVLRVVRGNPTPEELAALTVVLLAAGTSTAEAEPAPRSPWSRPALRGPLAPAPGAWAQSGLTPGLRTRAAW